MGSQEPWYKFCFGTLLNSTFSPVTRAYRTDNRDQQTMNDILNGSRHCRILALVVLATGIISFNAHAMIMVNPGNVGDVACAGGCDVTSDVLPLGPGTDFVLDFVFTDMKHVEQPLVGGNPSSYTVGLDIVYTGSIIDPDPQPALSELFISDEKGNNIGDALNLAAVVSGERVSYTGFRAGAPQDIFRDVHFGITAFSDSDLGVSPTSVTLFFVGDPLVGASANQVPEPGTAALLGLGLVGLVGFRKSKRRA